MKKAVIILLTAIAGRLISQSDSTTLAHGLFSQGRYGEAEPVLEMLLKKDPTNAILHFKTGICFLHSRSQKHKAISYLEKAIEYSSSLKNKTASENDAPAIAYKYLGDAYRINYRFYDAINAYEKYKELTGNKKTDSEMEITARVDQCLELCQFGKEIQESTLPVKLNIHELNQTSGTLGYYTSSISPNNSELIHTWKVPVEKAYLNDIKYFESTFIQKKDTSLEKPPSGKVVGTASKSKEKQHDTIVNITTIGTSVDGQVMLTYLNERGNAVIYISRLSDNKWSTPVKLPKTVNKGGWEPNEYVSFDGNYLYFASDRPGGYGGKDIYRCKKLANGEWSKAENLGPTINSEHHEEAPFLHQDGTTLYYSSNRIKPALSYDIFASTLKDSVWQKPLIVGYPINSSEQDVFYQVGTDKKRIAKEAAEEKVNKRKTKKKKSDKKQTEDHDYYLITFLNPQMSSLTILKGEVVEKMRKTTKPIQATITVTDNNSGKCQGIYFTDLSRGAYSFVVPSEKSNNITFEAEGYLFCSENIAVKNDTNYFQKYKSIYLQPLKEGATSELNNIFFEKDKATLQASAKGELEKLYHFMVNHPEVEINVNSYIYSKEKYYKPLSEERAAAIVKFLEEKGIDKKRLEAKGYRKSLPKEQSHSGSDEYLQKIEIEIDDIQKK